MSNKAWFGAMTGQGGYQARAVTFDGTNDYLTRGADFTGNADGKVGAFSCWVKNNADGVRKGIYDGDRVDFFINASNGFEVQLETSGASNVFLTNSATNTLQVSSGWVHVLCSWDVANNLGHLYLDDVDAEEAGEFISNLTIDYTRSNHVVGANAGFADKLNGDLADLYFNNAEYIDITVEANRRKFISADGKPVNLGVDGSLPTGTSPRLFLSLANGDAVSTFATNKGTGGGMTTTGTLTEAGTSPSD